MNKNDILIPVSVKNSIAEAALWVRDVSLIYSCKIPE